MLSRCIAVDPQEFSRTYWGSTPLLSPSETLPRDFSDLLSARMVDELVAERGVRAPFIRVAKDGDLLDRSSYLGPAGFGAEIRDQVDSGKLLGQFATGATIVLQGLHRLWPPIIDFVRGLVNDLGHPVQANAYITPPTGRGFDPHYDVHDVFVLQTAGHKHWTIHRPVHVDPLPSQPWTDHREAIARRVRDDAFIDTVLAPGDALYLPRGWVHSARALDETSIHLTIGVAPLTGMDVIRSVLDHLEQDGTFRRSLPLGVDPTHEDDLAALSAKLIAQVTDTLRDRSSALSDGAATHLVRKFASATRPVPVRPLASLGALDRAGVINVRWRHGLVSSLERDADRVCLQLSDRTISFPVSCADAVAALRDGLVANAKNLPGLDAADGEVVLRRLLREAVVVPDQDQVPDRTHDDDRA
jgi:hypothetical protein